MRRIVLKVLLVICGFFSGVVFMIYRCGYILKGEKKRADRFFAYFNLLDRWLVCKEHNNQFKDYFHKNCIDCSLAFNKYFRAIFTYLIYRETKKE